MYAHPHAISQFKKRSGSKRSDEWVANKLIGMVSQGKQVEYKSKRAAVKALLNHHIEPASYYFCDGWIIVVVENGQTIKTIYQSTMDRWKPTEN